MGFMDKIMAIFKPKKPEQPAADSTTDEAGMDSEDK